MNTIELRSVENLNAIADHFELFAKRHRDFGLMAGEISASDRDHTLSYLTTILLPQLQTKAAQYLAQKDIAYWFDGQFMNVTDGSLALILRAFFIYGDVGAWDAFKDLCTSSVLALPSRLRIPEVYPHDRWIDLLCDPAETHGTFVQCSWEDGRNPDELVGRFDNFKVHPALASAAYCRSLAREWSHTRLSFAIGSSDDSAAGTEGHTENERKAAVRSSTLNSDDKSAYQAVDYVTYFQMASITNQSKRTLERMRKSQVLPEPDVKGRNGQPHRWKWVTVRGILEKEYGIELPERYPPQSSKKIRKK